MIRVLAKVEINQGEKEQFSKYAKELVELSREEKGCIEYDFIDDKNTDFVFFIEKWSSKKELEKHLKTEHFKKYSEIFSSYIKKNFPLEIHEMDNLFFKRKSIRNYKEMDVENEKIEKILKAGMQAPSAGNQQGWKFIVIKNKEILEKLGKMSPYSTPILKSKVAIVILGLKNVRFPQNLEQDLGACAENILLQITELGLGGVWLGVSPEKDRMEYVSNLLELNKEEEYPFAVIPFGYTDDIKENQNRYDDKKIKWFE